MENSLEKSSLEQQISFKNEPPFSRHEADKSRNEKRLSITDEIKTFLSENERFKGKDVAVTFSHQGVSSLVSILETSEGKTVLKIPLIAGRSEEEGTFLKTWESAGVSVPHVLDEGSLGQSSYLLMSFVDAPSLKDAFGSYERLLEEEKFFEMGSTLHKMHQPKAQGYGALEETGPEYATFAAWLDREGMQKRIAYAQENGLLDERHGSATSALEILRVFAGDETESSYCHGDFCPENIFATVPITVFDPNPSLNHRYTDLAMALLIATAITGNEEAAKQIKEGYFPREETINEEALQASILLSAYVKFGRWHKIKNEKKITNVQEYLIKNKLF